MIDCFSIICQVLSHQFSPSKVYTNLLYLLVISFYRSLGIFVFGWFYLISFLDFFDIFVYIHGFIFPELRSAIGQIVTTEKNLFAVDAKKVTA